MRSRSFAVLGTALAAALAACSAPGGLPPNPAARTPIVPDATRVADASTRAALASFDAATGAMRFSQDTGQLASLRPDDVLVGEPSAAAPDGFLRKVKSVRREAGATVLETTQANITDAITQGSLDASGEFGPADLQSATALVKGLSVGVVRPAVEAGDGYRFQARFDETILDINEGNDENKVIVKVKVSGELYFNAGYSVGLGVEPCVELPPVCVDRFEASVGIEQRASLSVTGDASASITRERKVAEYRFRPIVFFIGPVPVVLVPSVYLYVGAAGEVNLRFSYSVSQSAKARVGAKWTDDRGWEDIGGAEPFSLSALDRFDLNAGLKARAYVNPVAGLMFYGVAGPAIGLKLGVELDAAIPRDPFWILRGFLEGYVALAVDLPVLGKLKEHKATVFNLTREFGRSPNSPPRIQILKPLVRADLGLSVSLGVYATDPEDGSPRVSLSSSLDGPIPFGSSYRFTTPGLRTITVTASDSRGATSTAQLQVDVVNAPPVAFGTVYNDTVAATVPYYVSAAATDPNSGRLGCDSLSWSVTAPDTVVGLSLENAACVAEVIFNVQGPRSVTLRARDAQGATSNPKSFSVYVTPAPPDPAPRIEWASIRHQDGKQVGDGDVYPYPPTLSLSVRATDPAQQPLSYRWEALCVRAGDPQVVPIPTGTDGTASYRPSGDQCVPTSSLDSRDITLSVRVSDGTTTVYQSRSFRIEVPLR